MKHLTYCVKCTNIGTQACHVCSSNGKSEPSHFFEKNKQIPVKPIPTIEPLHNINLIDHPPHYTTGKVEVIDYIEDKLTAEQFEGYCIGNVLKYVSRYRHKGGHEDLRKAVWYLNRVIEMEKSNDGA